MAEMSECGTCGFQWDDSVVTDRTPVPGPRTPCEYYHQYVDGEFVGIDEDEVARDADFIREVRGHWSAKMNDYNNSLQDQVERVATFLDQNRPDWVEVLVDAYGDDLAELHVSNPHSCVLSAVYGSYSEGIDTIYHFGGFSILTVAEAIAAVTPFEDKAREAWLEAVTERLNQ